MKYLLDTNVLIFASENSRLSEKAKRIISDTKNTLYMSEVSYWETAIKYSLGKLQLPSEPAVFLSQCVKELKLKKMNIKLCHYEQLSKLPPCKDHRDPFDRMIISQCISEKIQVLSSDEKFDYYPIKRIWD